VLNSTRYDKETEPFLPIYGVGSGNARRQLVEPSTPADGFLFYAKINKTMAKTVLTERQRSPRVFSRSMFNDEYLTIYRKDNTFYLSLNQVAKCNGIAKGGNDIYRYIDKKNCLTVVKLRQSKGAEQRIRYAPYSDVLAYLQHSRKESARNLYSAIIFNIKECEDAVKRGLLRIEKTGYCSKAEAMYAKKSPVKKPKHITKLVPKTEKQQWESAAAEYYATKSNKEKEEEKAGEYFTFWESFRLGKEVTLKQIRDNKQLFLDELKDALLVLLRIGEPLRGDARKEFTSVISCLGSHQALIQGL